jgi:Leucine-rich repeat (LRR) protein
MSYPSEQDIKQNLKQVCKTLDGKEWVLGNATLSGKGYAHLGDVLTSYRHLRYLDASENELGGLEAAPGEEQEEDAAPPAQEEAPADGEEGKDGSSEEKEPPAAKPHALQALTGLTSLLALNLSTNSILSFPKELKLPNVQIINVKTNRITDIPFNAEATPALINLNMSENALTSMEGLDGLSSLRVLAVNDNSVVTSLSGLGNLSSLEKLVASTCDLQDLNGLQGLTRSFTELDVANNKINSLEALSTAAESLKGLLNLNIANNAIEDLDELVHLASLRALSSVNLAGNPCADAEEFRIEVVLRVPTIKSISGEDVTSEERKNAKALAQQRKDEAAAEAAAAAAAAAEAEEEEEDA